MATMGRWRRQQPGAHRSRSNHRLAANWADSDETHKAPWSLISVTGTYDNSSQSANQLQVLLAGAGECLVDDVQVLDGIGNNFIANSSFETDASGWTAEGTEAGSSLETT